MFPLHVGSFGRGGGGGEAAPGVSAKYGVGGYGVGSARQGGQRRVGPSTGKTSPGGRCWKDNEDTHTHRHVRVPPHIPTGMRGDAALLPTPGRGGGCESLLPADMPGVGGGGWTRFGWAAHPAGPPRLTWTPPHTRVRPGCRCSGAQRPPLAPHFILPKTQRKEGVLQPLSLLESGE